MTKMSTKPLILLFFFVFVSSQKSFSQCFEIESILVAACSPPGPTTEGYNEMVRFRVGPNPINTSTLTVNWPSNSWQGLVQNATTAAKVATLNAAIDAAGGCGDLLQPVGGVLPANAPVILVTSYLMDTNSNSFGALAENTYIIFQNNPTATGGHFGNYNPSPATRTLTMNFGGGCSDTVTYERSLLTGAQGDTVLFTPAGTPNTATYVNFGCTAPVLPFSVDAGTAPTNPCAGTTISLLGTAEGYQSVAWTATDGTFSSSSTLATNYTIPANAGGQTITLTLAATNSCGVMIQDSVVINVVNITTPTFNLPTTLCSGDPAPVLPTISTNGVTGIWSPATVSNTVSGSYVFTPNAGQCSEPFFLSVTIQNGSPTVTGFSYTTPVCSDNAPILPSPVPGFTSGGTYTSDLPGLSLNINTGEINVVASTPGQYIVKYEILASGCQAAGVNQAPIEIKSRITPGVSFSYPSSICKSDTSVMIIPGPGFTPGGVFTSDSGLSINPTTGEVNPSASTPNPHSVIYFFPADPANCVNPNTSPALITFDAEIAPAVSFSYPAQVCLNSAPVSPTTFPGTTGGVFTATAGLIINPTTGEVNVLTSTVGLHTITYTVVADPAICQGGDSFPVPFEITNGLTPETGFFYTTPVCITNSSPVFPSLFPGFMAGGVFSATPGLSVDPNSGEINVTASTPGSHTVTYAIAPDPANCNAGGTSPPVSITINNLTPPVTSFGYTSPVCPDSPQVNPNPLAGFTWGGIFSSDPGLSINPNTGQINVAASTAGPHTIIYTLLQNDATCTAGGSDMAQFIIDAGTVLPPITGDPFLCVGGTLQLANATPGGTWSSSDDSIATVDDNGLVTGIVSDFVDIIYTVNDGCSPTVRTTLAIYPLPEPLLQDRYLCVNNLTGQPYNSVRIECGVPNQGFSFAWTLDGNPLPTTTNAHVATEVGVYEVTVTDIVSGCSNATSCNVWASSAAVATASVGEDFNQNQVITVNVTGGGSGDYLFQLDHGVPQESNVFPYAYQGEYTITVIDKNGCQDLELTVFALNYPRFFTPNGDGFNDTWGIKGLTDLKAKTYIFDRFGKLVKYLNAFGEEWDGTLNGYELPSTDYWFLLEYKNRDGLDKEFKAHFSLKR